MSTRERLLAGAQDLLWERGYVGTSPRALQQRAGAGQGSMYHHFAGKADLAVAALRCTADEQRDRAQELLDGPGSAADRIVEYLRRERDPLRGCPMGRHTQDPELVADATLRAPVQETFAWLQDRLTELVAEAQRAGDVTADVDARAVAAAVAATVQGGYVLARAAASPEPFRQAVEGGVQMVRALAPNRGGTPCT